jgi:hypothetical protein
MFSTVIARSGLGAALLIACSSEPAPTEGPPTADLPNSSDTKAEATVDDAAELAPRHVAPSLAKGLRQGESFGQVAITGLSKIGQRSLSAWTGEVVLREMENGGAEVELSFGAGDRDGATVMRVSLRSTLGASDGFRLPTVMEFAEGVGTGRKTNAALWSDGRWHRARGAVNELVYEGGTVSGRLSSTFVDVDGESADIPVQATFQGDLALRCFVLVKPGESVAGAPGGARSTNGRSHRMQVDVSHPFCRRYL